MFFVVWYTGLNFFRWIIIVLKIVTMLTCNKLGRYTLLSLLNCNLRWQGYTNIYVPPHIVRFIGSDNTPSIYIFTCRIIFVLSQTFLTLTSIFQKQIHEVSQHVNYILQKYFIIHSESKNINLTLLTYLNLINLIKINGQFFFT